MSCAIGDLSVPQCLSDPRDRILLSQAPLIPMPTFGTLPPPPMRARQYVGATDGIYVQARHHGLAVTALLSAGPLPYGPLEPSFHLPGGLIPFELIDTLRNAAVAACPLEWAGVVHWQEQESEYRLHFPRIISRSTRSSQFQMRLVKRTLKANVSMGSCRTGEVSDVIHPS